MTTLSTYKALLFVLSILFFATSCSKEESGMEQGAIVSVKIKGASKDVNQIILDIEEVQLLMESSQNESFWLPLETINKGKHNISKYGGNNELRLVNSSLVSSGQVQKIKLVLGVDNAIIIDGNLKHFDNYRDDLEISNLVPTTLGVNKSYEFTMEIEADNSVVIIENNLEFVPEMNTMMRHINIK